MNVLWKLNCVLQLCGSDEHWILIFTPQTILNCNLRGVVRVGLLIMGVTSTHWSQWLHGPWSIFLKSWSLCFKLEVVKFHREKLSDSRLDIGLLVKTKSRKAKRYRSVWHIYERRSNFQSWSRHLHSHLVIALCSSWSIGDLDHLWVWLRFYKRTSFIKCLLPFHLPL